MLSRKKWLLDVDWRLVILDEAQAIKNPHHAPDANGEEAQRGGENRPYGDARGEPTFRSLVAVRFPVPGPSRRGGQVQGVRRETGSTGTGTVMRLSGTWWGPYILRRLKTDKSIIADLPDKTEMRAFCGLKKKQAALYARSVEELAEALDGRDDRERRGLVLAYLMKFKQICNHPSQFLGDGEYDPAQSGKFDRLRAICEEIASRQEKVLVFTQFREMTEPVAAFLGGLFGREGLVLHGGTAVRKRQKLIDSFQADEGPPFFVLSLKAGGTGLNLTAASHVVHFDRWWNPAVENQATDRAFRIGQHRNVVVHKFICRGTVEEKIDALIEEKTDLADHVLKAGTGSMLTEMSDDEVAGGGGPRYRPGPGVGE